jgi:phospholipase/carboxylesterase
MQLTPEPLAVLEREVPDPDGTLVLLHGRGADEHDLFGLFDVLDPGRRWRGITVGAPFRLNRPAHLGKHWYVVPQVGFPHPETFHHAFAALTEELDRRVDWSTTVVGGFSQGTVMSYALALGTGRPVPAGLLALSGFIPTVEGWTPDLASRPGLPVLIAHGTQDPVIGIDFARRARALLEAGGLPVEVHETPMAHSIDPRVVPELARWLEARRPVPTGS